MKFELSVERITPDTDKTLDYIVILTARRRRAKWFEYTRRRFDLVCLGKIADWCSREERSVICNPEKRLEVETALFDSISLGEFGGGDWPSIAWMQQGVPVYNQGQFPLRLSVGQIAYFRNEWPNLIGDLWAPRELCARWLKGRDVPQPPWLSMRTNADQPTQEAVDKWMTDLYQAARRDGRSPPKRELDAFPACRAAIGATDPQMRAAMKRVPAELKRGRGGRDR